jgi:hypothetical protein
VFEDLLLKNLFQIDNKDMLINILNLSFFGCSEEFWGVMSKAVTNLYGEVNIVQIINIIACLNREKNLKIEMWQDLVEKIESDYSMLDDNLKVKHFF